MTLFYDHIVVIEEIETKINNIVSSPEEKEELWRVVDELIHHRVLVLVFENLSREHHDEFLVKLYERPHDKGLIKYLNDKTGSDIEDLIRTEIKKIEEELLSEFVENS